MDLFPTLCGCAGGDAPKELNGENLADTVETEVEPDRRPVVCVNRLPRWRDGTEFRTVLDGQYEYIAFREAPELLFDLSADPFEQYNLAPSADGDDREALGRMRGFVQEAMDFDAVGSERERDGRLQEKFALDAEPPSASGNCYFMPNGSVVDADQNPSTLRRSSSPFRRVRSKFPPGEAPPTHRDVQFL